MFYWLEAGENILNYTLLIVRQYKFIYKLSMEKKIKNIGKATRLILCPYTYYKKKTLNSKMSFLN